MALLLAAGCASQRGGAEVPEEQCTYCHGDPAAYPDDPLRRAAPPQGLHLAGAAGATSTDEAGVGAHQAHLGASAVARPLDCTECHVVPRVDGQLYSSAPGHIGGSLTAEDATPGRAELTFDGRAVMGGVAADYDYATNGCTTYCHGVTLAGGSNTRPTWNRVGQGQAECGSCHGLPPDRSGHPQSTLCSKCHPTVDAAMQIVDRDRHVDGTVDVSAGMCSACHGSDQNAAPPVDTLGRADTTLVSVGAHQAHLREGPIAAAFACGECHVVPDAANPTEHIDGVPRVSFGPLATADGATPSWGGTTCTGYCHGQTLSGGTLTAPQWTTVDGSQAACGTCHGLPPQGGHPPNGACHLCHPDVDASRTITDKTRHVNGVVDLVQTFTCTSCHGDAVANNPAPPVGTNGETQTSQAAVGAHQQHLAASSWHRSGQCVDCHAVPTVMAHSDGQVDFAWGAPSNADGATPAYVAAGATCANVYCHGTTLLGAASGGSVKRTPVWTTVDGTYDACGSTCHTNPPGGSHPASTACENCHGAVIAAYAAGSPPTVTWADAQRHVDGTVDVVGTSCTSCHGNSGTGDPAPPTGFNGETATNTLSVGRHAQHLTASSTHVAFSCDTCHVLPAAGDSTHAAGHVASASLATAGHHGDVTLSGRAAGMTWDVNATQGAPVTARGTCTGACHSNGRGAAPQVTPYWAGGTWNTGSCNSCHGASPNSGRHGTHDGELSCAGCHPAANTATHMDGQPTVFGTITGLAGQGGGSITTKAPPNGDCSNNRWSCSGTCHDKWHEPFCW